MLSWKKLFCSLFLDDSSTKTFSNKSHFYLFLSADYLSSETDDQLLWIFPMIPALDWVQRKSDGLIRQIAKRSLKQLSQTLHLSLKLVWDAIEINLKQRYGDSNINHHPTLPSSEEPVSFFCVLRGFSFTLNEERFRRTAQNTSPSTSYNT